MNSEQIIGWAMTTRMLWERDHKVCRLPLDVLRRRGIRHVNYCAVDVELKILDMRRTT